jgi:hypothetical protein
MITSKVQGIFIALSLLLPVLALPLFSQETRAVKVMDFEQLKPLLHSTERYALHREFLGNLVCSLY